ncbi:MAG: radical SAM family heme chaperone HemW [Chthoniobacterales bacterium]
METHVTTEGEIDKCAHAFTHRTPIEPAILSPILTHIYVHIPFCARICPYCAFYKERADPAQTQRFCDAVLRELNQQCEMLDLRPETIFFGGGTPTALSTEQLEYVLSGFRERLNFSALHEWTVEANPGSVSPRKAAMMKRAGVTRISLGVQSWNDRLLRLLGREHDAAHAEASVNILRDAGFQNLNIDLMFGLPGQSIAEWQETLDKTVALQPEHISAYCLTYEEDTEFFARQARGEFRQESESDAEFFVTASRLLEGAGYEHYETSNYARNGYASLHNRGYWAGEDYLGIGPSAFSTVGFERRQNICDYRGYADRLLNGESAVASTEQLSEKMKRGEKIALLLRTNTGVPVAWLEDQAEEVDEFLRLSLLRKTNGRYVLTPKGELLADSVAEAFV